MTENRSENRKSGGIAMTVNRKSGGIAMTEEAQ